MGVFFVHGIIKDEHVICGEDAHHISRVLRMTAGDTVKLCDPEGTVYDCIITEITKNEVRVKCTDSSLGDAEPTIEVHIFVGMPKSDKFEFIIQKAVELGAASVTPVICERSVSRPEKRSLQTRLERCSKIALQAAMQSGRNRVPKVNNLLSFTEAMEIMRQTDLKLFFYEGGGLPLSRALSEKDYKTVAIFTGPEGGLSSDELKQAETMGITVVSLGKRILRCETAPLAALSAVMYHTGNLN